MGRNHVRSILAIASMLATLGLGGCGASESAPDEPEDPGGGDAGPAPDAQPATDSAPTLQPDASPACPILTYPTGVSFATKPDAALTAEYLPIAEEPNYPLPVCFVDTDDLLDAKTGTRYDVDVKVGKYFTMRELVGTSLKYTRRVLLSPLLVEKLDRYHDALQESVNLTSGYRSPAHQRDVCQSICGQDSCGNVCAARSRHSWGDAADHGVTPTKKYSDAGCAADFNYVYREGNHMHLDLNPQHPICTVDVL